MIKYRDQQGKVREVEGDLFVVKDVKGNDIFAGDKVYFTLYRCRGRESGVIKWQQERYRCAFYFNSGKEGPWGFTDEDTLELIEDKSNG